MSGDNWYALHVDHIEQIGVGKNETHWLLLAWAGDMRCTLDSLPLSEPKPDMQQWFEAHRQIGAKGNG